MKKDVKEEIVSVAQKMFKRFGFRKTTMDEIAVVACKGKSSLYYYFKSKEEVFEAVIEKEAAILREDINMNVGKCNSAMEKLRTYIYVRMDGFRNWGNFYEALKDDYLSNYEFIEKIRIKYDSNEISAVTQIINEGIENKEFKVLNAGLAAKIIVTAMKGLEVPLLTVNDKKTNFKSEINNMLEVLFHGICV